MDAIVRLQAIPDVHADRLAEFLRLGIFEVRRRQVRETRWLEARAVALAENHDHGITLPKVR